MMTIENIIFGYKIQYTEYNMINYITFASYSIYRAYYISENQTSKHSLAILRHNRHFGTTVQT